MQAPQDHSFTPHFPPSMNQSLFSSRLRPKSAARSAKRSKWHGTWGC